MVVEQFVAADGGITIARIPGPVVIGPAFLIDPDT
jgi:hypothetical protein